MPEDEEKIDETGDNAIFGPAQHPQDVRVMQLAAALPLFTATDPTLRRAPYAGYRAIYLTGGVYYLCVYVNKVWTKTKLGAQGDSEIVGVVKMYAVSTPPTGYLLCDGSAVSRTTYSSLFTVINTTFGAGDGSTTFNVPDLRGRVPVGPDPSGAGGMPTIKPAFAGIGGEEKHTLTTAELPTAAMINAAGNILATAGSGIAESGAGGGAHNNVQAFLAISFIIKAI